MSEVLDVDHVVVGAGASGLAFVDALVEHAPDVTVALVDRRHGVGGHWREAYPFVRLHQASEFYGVASTPLGDGRVQASGPEAGLPERADRATVLSYYGRVLTDRLLGSGRVRVLAGWEHDASGEGRSLVSRLSGERLELSPRARLVDARYLAPRVPAEVPPPFAVGDGARVVPVNALDRVDAPPSRYVVVGSGKTATDAVVWLLTGGVDPDDVTWVRPREPWMLNREVVQPDPVRFTTMSADVMTAASRARDLDDFFERLEDAGVMLRIDRDLTPTMAKGPTLGTWELDLLRSVRDVVRLGHVRAVTADRLELDGGTVDLPPGALVVSCAADGLRNRPLVPIWAERSITLQPVRAGFPCFGSAAIGYVEATRTTADADRGDAAKNRLCRPSPLGNTPADWARMQVIGTRNLLRLTAEPDLADWASRVAVNPGRVPPGHPGSPDLDAARERLLAHRDAGLARLEQLVDAD